MEADGQFLVKSEKPEIESARADIGLDLRMVYLLPSMNNRSRFFLKNKREYQLNTILDLTLF